jgi:hypothetical protein
LNPSITLHYLSFSSTSLCLHLSSSFSVYHVFFNSFPCISLYLVPIWCDVFQYYSLTIILFFPSSSSLL